MKSLSYNNLFNSVKLNRPKSNVFDLSHEKKLSMNMGDLVPVYLQDVVPGDKFRVNTESLIRLSPLIAPMMHRVNAYIHYFFVPNRIIWSEWEKFITGGEDGLQAPVYPKCVINDGTKALCTEGSLIDYLGLPVHDGVSAITNPLYFSALPLRAYQLIYNEYYRDQNLQAKIEFSLGSGVELDLFAMRKRCWEKDYFTSCLPWTQRGANVNLPNTPDYSDTSLFKKEDGTIIQGAVTSGNVAGELAIDGSLGRVENIDGINISINDLRRATKLQQWLERNALGGSRYIEQIFAHFGVTSSNRSLQRPQYLGGGKTPIVVSEVLNTSATATEDQGNMSGHGISVGNTNRFESFFEEHGFILGIMSVLPRTAYQQGIEKHWTKFDKLEHYFPEFANLGEQAVTDGEVYHDYDAGAGASDNTFGYQSRYSEYKFKNSSVHGSFKSSLSYWHLGRIFGAKPSLNGTFVTPSASELHRIFAVTDPAVHKLYVQLYHDVKAIRPMPVFGTPTL